MNENGNGFIPNNEPTPTYEPVNEPAPTAEPINEPAPSVEPASVNEPVSEPVQPTQPEEAPQQTSYYTDTQRVENPYSAQYSSQGNFSNDPSSFYSQFQSSAPAEEPKKKKKNKGFVAFVIVAVVLAFIALGLCLLIGLYSYDGNTEANPPASSGSEITIMESPTPSKDSESLATIQIAENAEKINVGIMIYGKTQSFLTGTSDSLVGEGSGILMSVDKTNTYTYILTCAHVIKAAKDSKYTITVQDSEGNTYDGIMVGCDEKTDIGVIKIKATGLPLAQFGDSSSLKKGQKVYAIGNPGGMEFFGSFTDGMISSIDRPISSESGYEMKCIQHSTPINSGNSGGALLNEFGQVIGINSSKIVSTGYEGMAFSIPISDAKPIIDDLVANGTVTNRPKLGISYTAAMQYQQYAMIIQLKELPAGSLIIRDINPDSSLASTKAEVYDLIIAVDGKDLDTPDVLLDKIENGKVGDKLTLTLCRIGNDYSISEFDVTVELVEDKGTTSPTTSQEQLPNSYWEQFFGN